MAEDLTQFELYFNPKHFRIFEMDGQFWIQKKTQKEEFGQPELLVSFLKNKYNSSFIL